MVASSVLECLVLGWIGGQGTARLIVLSVFGTVFCVMFLTGVELYHMQDGAFNEKEANNKVFALWYCVFCLFAILIVFFPEFARPVLLLGLGMSVVANQFFGMVAGIFHVSAYVLSGEGGMFPFLCFLFLLMGGCMAASFFEKRENLAWKDIFLFLYSFSVVLVFSYLQSGKLEQDMLIYGLCNGVFSSIGADALHRSLSSNIRYSQKRILQKILRDNFGLVRDIRAYSAADYEHARRVSKIAEGCAKVIGADAEVAAAGGFYYRLGRMMGEPYVENGVALAESSHLPQAVIEILEEYNGEKRAPTTLESAIVHIADSIVAKFDILDKETLKSSWNHDILVYQTLNENSAAGIYDKSGFSMNMFLKIRDYLIKEAELF